MSDWMTIAEHVAREAGAMLREGYGSAKTIEHKGVIDLVTEFDRRSEALIVSALRQAFPDHAIRAEEGSGNSSAGEYEWLGGPLDGTTHFPPRFPRVRRVARAPPARPTRLRRGVRSAARRVVRRRSRSRRDAQRFPDQSFHANGVEQIPARHRLPL